jgi:ABC-2 type transport system permease protein
MLTWMIGSGVLALVIGTVSTSISSAGLSSSVQQQLHKIGSVSVTTPAGYIAFTFLFYAVAFSLFAASQVAAARREEAEQRLETLLALPVSRRRWLTGRLFLAAAAAAALAAVAGLLTWVGAASQHANVSLAKLLEAGANTLPATLLFLGVGALAFAIVPRASSGIAYGLAALAFVWDLFGALLGAPGWLLGLSPFHHIALVPVQSFRTAAAIVMCAIAVIAGSAAVELFARRDLRAD